MGAMNPCLHTMDSLSNRAPGPGPRVKMTPFWGPFWDPFLGLWPPTYWLPVRIGPGGVQKGVPKWTPKMAQNGSFWAIFGPYRAIYRGNRPISPINPYIWPIWAKMAQNGSKWPFWPKMAQNGHFGPFGLLDMGFRAIFGPHLAIWPKMAILAQNGPKWPFWPIWPYFELNMGFRAIFRP